MILTPWWGFTPWHGSPALRIVSTRGEQYALNQQFNHTRSVKTDIHSDSLINKLPEAARTLAGMAADGVRHTSQKAAVVANYVTGEVEDLAGDLADATKDAAHRVTDKAQHLYQSAALKAGHTLAVSKAYVRRNPVPVILGSIAIGAAVGYLIINARRKQSFSEKYVEKNLNAVREAILCALSPVAQRVHDGYDLARDGVEKAIDRVKHFGPGRTHDSLSDRIGRFGNNLKFW